MRGLVTYGLEVDISLSHCLTKATGNLPPKATTGSKSREVSFGTTLFGATSRDAMLILLFLCK